VIAVRRRARESLERVVASHPGIIPSHRRQSSSSPRLDQNHCRTRKRSVHVYSLSVAAAAAAIALTLLELILLLLALLHTAIFLINSD